MDGMQNIPAMPSAADAARPETAEAPLPSPRKPLLRNVWATTRAVFGSLLVVFGLTGTLWVAFVTIFLLGITYGFVAAPNETLIQLLVDESYRGRVMSVYAMITGLAPGGALLAGWIATMLGIGWALVSIGAIMLLYIPFLWFRTQLAAID